MSLMCGMLTYNCDSKSATSGGNRRGAMEHGPRDHTCVWALSVCLTTHVSPGGGARCLGPRAYTVSGDRTLVLARKGRALKFIVKPVKLPS
eukprot:2654445-Prymnesium_polylepis.1